MTLREFARLAGVSIHRCPRGWGGKYGWRTADNPDCTYLGYQTIRAAREAWAIETFGERAARALFVLLKGADGNGESGDAV